MYKRFCNKGFKLESLVILIENNLYSYNILMQNIQNKKLLNNFGVLNSQEWAIAPK